MFTVHPELYSQCSMCSHICFVTLIQKSFGRMLFSAHDIVLNKSHSISLIKRFETSDFDKKLRKEQVFFNESCHDDNKHQKVKTIWNERCLLTNKSVQNMKIKSANEVSNGNIRLKQRREWETLVAIFSRNICTHQRLQRNTILPVCDKCLNCSLCSIRINLNSIATNCARCSSQHTSVWYS